MLLKTKKKKKKKIADDYSISTDNAICSWLLQQKKVCPSLQKFQLFLRLGLKILKKVYCVWELDQPNG